MTDATNQRLTSDEIDRAIDVVARDLTAIDAPADLRARVVTQLSESHAPAFERRWSWQWAMAGAVAVVLVASLAWWVAVKPAAGPGQRFAGKVGGGVRPPMVSMPAGDRTQVVPVVASNSAAPAPVIRRSAVRGSMAGDVGEASVEAMSNGETMAAIAIEAIAQRPIEIEQINIAPISIPTLTAIAPIEIGEVSDSIVQ